VFPLIDCTTLTEEDLLARMQLVRERMTQASRSGSYSAANQLNAIYTEYMLEYQARSAQKNQSTDWNKQIDIS
jgi:hypothetical protein